jgi:hypothetical protein
MHSGSVIGAQVLQTPSQQIWLMPQLVVSATPEHCPADGVVVVVVGTSSGTHP